MYRNNIKVFSHIVTNGFKLTQVGVLSRNCCSYLAAVLGKLYPQLNVARARPAKDTDVRDNPIGDVLIKKKMFN